MIKQGDYMNSVISIGSITIRQDDIDYVDTESFSIVTKSRNLIPLQGKVTAASLARLVECDPTEPAGLEPNLIYVDKVFVDELDSSIELSMLTTALGTSSNILLKRSTAIELRDKLNKVLDGDVPRAINPRPKDDA
jgi:hypothetical protein